MRAWQLTERFGVDALRLVERPRPALGPGQVRLQLKAWSLNYRDLLVVLGHYNPRQRLPLVPGSDTVGEVVEVGAGVTRVSVGDRVCPIFAQGWLGGRPTEAATRTSLGSPGDGVFAEEVVLSEEGLVVPPAHLTDAECAALPCAAVTAWRALVTEGGVTAGDTVLTLGTGGVSLFALQIAKMLGARVGVTSSSDEKLARARAMGADFTVNYAEDARWGRTVRDALGPVDHVVEVGGVGTLEQSLAAVRVGGTISLIGVLSGVKAPLSLTRVLMRGIRVQGVFVGCRDDFEGLNRALAAHPDQRPVVDRALPFTALPAALAQLQEQRHMGKIVLERG